MRILTPVVVTLVLLSNLFTSLVVLASEEKAEKKIDSVALAALLVKGGDFEKADKALANVIETDEGLDLARFYTVKGLVKLRLQDYAQARDSYLNAQVNGQEDNQINVYLAQSYYGLNDYRNVLQSLEDASEIWIDNPRVWQLKAMTYWAQKDYPNTMQTLLDAQAYFPGEKQFVQRRVFLLIELGLYQQAVKIGLASLENGDSESVDFQTIGKAMIEAGQYSLALPVLEKAILIYPNDVTLLRTLSRTYVLLEQFYSAATLLERAAAQDYTLNSEVAELYRKSNKSEQALYFNQIVIDQNKKYKQRLAIYLDAGRFDDAIGMKDTLYRVGLLKDGNIRYALAYAYFSVGKYKQTERYLDGIREPGIFRKATQLRKAMLACEKAPAQC